MSKTRRLLREPLVHFVVLGGALFALYKWVAPVGPGRRLDVSAPVIAGLEADHQQRLGSAPTAKERAALVQGYVDHELLYREALALGLDRGDVIVRRRLIQKMQFYLQELDPTPEPSDAQLAAYLAAHPAAYAGPERVSLEQVFVAGGGERAGAEAERLRAALVSGADPARLGNPFVHGRMLRARSGRELAALLGAGFADAVLALAPGEWSAPIRSAYGLHLVRVDERVAAPPPSLASAREALRRDWKADERARLDRAAMDRLRSRYSVRIAEAR